MVIVSLAWYNYIDTHEECEETTMNQNEADDLKMLIGSTIDNCWRLDRLLDKLEIPHDEEWRLSLNGVLDTDRAKLIYEMIDSMVGDPTPEERLREYAKKLLYDYVVGKCRHQDFGISYSPDTVWKERSDEAGRWAIDAGGWWDYVPLTWNTGEYQFVSLKDFLTVPKPYGWRGDKR